MSKLTDVGSLHHRWPEHRDAVLRSDGVEPITSGQGTDRRGGRQLYDETGERTQRRRDEKPSVGRDEVLVRVDDAPAQVHRIACAHGMPFSIKLEHERSFQDMETLILARVHVARCPDIGGATRWNNASVPSESSADTFTSVSSPPMFSGASVLRREPRRRRTLFALHAALILRPPWSQRLPCSWPGLLAIGWAKGPG